MHDAQESRSALDTHMGAAIGPGFSASCPMPSCNCPPQPCTGATAPCWRHCSRRMRLLSCTPHTQTNKYRNTEILTREQQGWMQDQMDEKGEVPNPGARA